MSKPDFIRTPDSNNTIVEHHFKVKGSLIIPVGPGLTIAGLQDTDGHIYLKVDPETGDVLMQAWANGAVKEFLSRDMLHTIATSGSYADLDDKPVLFSGSYADLQGKPALFSGSYADLSGKPDLSNFLTTGYVPVWEAITGKPAFFSGDYNDLSNKPALNFMPAGYVPAWGEITGKPAFFSGDYNDLANKPALNFKPAGYVPAWGEITGKPAFFSGDYNDLANKPALNFKPAGYVPAWGEITGKPAFFSGDYNDLANKPTIPTKLADLVEGDLQNMDGAPFPIANGAGTKLFIARNTLAGYDAVDYYSVASANPISVGGHRFYTYNPVHGESGGVQFNFGTFGTTAAFYTGDVIVPGRVDQTTGIDGDTKIVMLSPFNGELMYVKASVIAELLSTGSTEPVNKVLSGADFADESVFTGSGYYTYYGDGVHNYPGGGSTQFLLAIPQVSSTGNWSLKIRNNGSAAILLGASDGVPEFYTTEATNSISIAPGEMVELHNDTEYWNIN